MRRLDETPIDPEVAASLDAIDATLAGEPVDPRHAELAELALLLAAERPQADPAFATLLDEGVERRFTKASAQERPRRRRSWLAPAGGLAAAATAAVVAIVVLSGGSGGASHGTTLPTDRASSAAHVPGASVAKLPAVGEQHVLAFGASASRGATSTASRQLSRVGSPAVTTTPTLAPAPSNEALALAPTPNGRKVIQGAQLALSTAARRVDQVAQEVFVVVGEQNGIVSNSSVTQGGPGGYASFQLSIPSGSLPQAMAALSTLPYAHVASRTDSTQDVTGQYQSDVRSLADARALRTSLLKQLANATTQTQIDSLTAQIHDAEASISSDEATLRALSHQVDYSQVSLTINAAPIVVTPAKGGGFTIRKGAHDAGRVLTVAAGVALIAAAALLPLALLAALGWWIAAMLRRRRREQALDAA